MSRTAQERTSPRQGTAHAHIRLDGDNNLAVHTDAGAATKEADPTGAFDTEADFREAVADWPAGRPVDVGNGLADAPPLMELKETKRFTDRKSAVENLKRRPAPGRDARRGDEDRGAGHAPGPAGDGERDETGERRAHGRSRSARPVESNPKEATGADNAPAPKQCQGTRKATVLALLEREGGATLEEKIAETNWQRHSVRGCISTLASKHCHVITSTRRGGNPARVYATTRQIAPEQEKSPSSLPASFRVPGKCDSIDRREHRKLKVENASRCDPGRDPDRAAVCM